MSNLSTEVNSPTQSYSNLVFAIEGNIGAGKSTFLNILDKGLNGDFEFYPEPVSAWRNIANGRVNLFEMMYNDPIRWGFSFQ